MKNILFLLTSLLAVGSALVFSGYNANWIKDDGRTKIHSVEDGGNDDNCQGCKERGMPKVRFEFKDGRPN